MTLLDVVFPGLLLAGLVVGSLLVLLLALVKRWQRGE
jgi:hypothetical protein